MDGRTRGMHSSPNPNSVCLPHLVSDLHCQSVRASEDLFGGVDGVEITRDPPPRAELAAAPPVVAHLAHFLRRKESVLAEVAAHDDAVAHAAVVPAAPDRGLPLDLVIVEEYI